MKHIFLDTVGMLAIWDENDPWHEAAEKAWRDIVTQRSILITTSYILLECGNAVARSPFRTAVDELRRQLEFVRGLVHPTEADWVEAWGGYTRREAAEAGIVDHVSF